MRIDLTPFAAAFAHFVEELQHLRSNRPMPSLIDSIPVKAYGSTMRIQELASIVVPEAQTLLIQPWDASVTQAIEQALREGDYHFNPVVDGQNIRIHFPPLTEEKRRDLVKIVNQKAEDARISIRKVREEQLKKAKEAQKNGDISEDDYFRFEKEMQAIVDDHNAQIKSKTESKEKELMTI